MDNDLGIVSDNSCWLWSDGRAGPYKLVMCIDPLMSSPTDVVLLADQVYSNCLELGFTQAKLYLSDNILLVLYLAEREKIPIEYEWQSRALICNLFIHMRRWQSIQP